MNRMASSQIQFSIYFQNMRVYNSNITIGHKVTKYKYDDFENEQRKWYMYSSQSSGIRTRDLRMILRTKSIED